jgi:hypothetical protein
MSNILETFDIISNANHQFYGEQIVLFYADSIGTYPYLLANGSAINGGLPQVDASIYDWFKKATTII